MIIAAHQPNFLPWLGFFDKMRRADIFLLVDHVQFERQNFQNRTMIKTGDGPRWMTVPVRQNSRDERIADKMIDNSRQGRLRWGRKMLTTLKYAYQAAPYFDTYAPELSEIFEERWENLAPLNLRLIEFCRKVLEIRTPMRFSSEMNIAGTKSDMVLDLCRQFNAQAYLAGNGGSKGYLDAAAFAEAGIQIQWQDFHHPLYDQTPAREDFVEKLSILDLIFNCGPRSGKILQGEVLSCEATTPQEALVYA
jgi:hypothetical protein